MRKHPRSLDFKYGVLSRGSSQKNGDDEDEQYDYKIRD